SQQLPGLCKIEWMVAPMQAKPARQEIQQAIPIANTTIDGIEQTANTIKHPRLQQALKKLAVTLATPETAGGMHV
ncbi:MAG: hypothetical protein JKY13_00165, partial [Gammaproteobacteria bacterium]|nr:hypothetical protein [Gammaproteobacteria bacterium]